MIQGRSSQNTLVVCLDFHLPICALVLEDIIGKTNVADIISRYPRTRREYRQVSR